MVVHSYLLCTVGRVHRVVPAPNPLHVVLAKHYLVSNYFMNTPLCMPSDSSHSHCDVISWPHPKILFFEQQ